MHKGREQPDQAPGDRSTLYDVLGVDREADADTIKRAHRKAARKHHPDAGGAREDFETIQRAYLVLSNPERRERYDRTGEEAEERDDKLATIAAHIMSAFDQAAAEAGPLLERTDLIAATRKVMEGKRRTGEKQRAALIADLDRMKRVLKRVRFNGQGFDPIGNTIRHRIADAERALPRADKEIADFIEAIAYLEQYGFDFEQFPVASSAWIGIDFTA